MFDSGHFLALAVFTESRSRVAYRDSGLFISLASAHLQMNARARTHTHRERERERDGGSDRAYQLKMQFSYSDSHNTTGAGYHNNNEHNQLIFHSCTSENSPSSIFR